MTKKQGKRLRRKLRAANLLKASTSILNDSAKKKGKANRRKPTTISIGSSPTSTSSPRVQPTVVAHTKVASNAKTTENRNEGFAGFIFMCNAKTKAECYRYRVFGLPDMKKEEVEKIKPGMKLFLFDFELKLLYGIYKATSGGELDLEPNAFSRRFRAQVRFKIFRECLPLRESDFKNAILNNYEGRSKFKPDLTRKQVKSLVSLFHDINELLPATAAAPQPTAIPTPVPNVAPPYHHPLPYHHPPPLHDGPPYRHSYPYPQDHAYLSGLHHREYQPHHIVPPSAYDRYEAAGPKPYVQLPVEPRYAVQPYPHYPGGVHQPYVPEHPVPSTEDLYRKYGAVAPEALKDRRIGYESEYHPPKVPSDGGTVHQSKPLIDYYSRYLPHVPATHPPPVTATHAPPVVATQLPPVTASQAPLQELPSYYPSHYYTVPAYGDRSYIYADPRLAPPAYR